jgi:hypothetical protein
MSSTLFPALASRRRAGSYSADDRIDFSKMVGLLVQPRTPESSSAWNAPDRNNPRSRLSYQRLCPNSR